MKQRVKSVPAPAWSPSPRPWRFRRRALPRRAKISFEAARGSSATAGSTCTSPARPRASLALTALRPDVLFEVVLAVIEREFLAGLDVAPGVNQNLLPDGERLGIRRAGVVDVAGGVASGAAVEGVLVAEREEVLAAHPARLFVRDDDPDVLDDSSPRLDRPEREESQPRGGALDGKAAITFVHPPSLSAKTSLKCHRRLPFS